MLLFFYDSNVQRLLPSLFYTRLKNMVRLGFWFKCEEIKNQKCGRRNKKAKLAAQSHESIKEVEADRTTFFRT